jgi:hypothetical protein
MLHGLKMRHQQWKLTETHTVLLYRYWGVGVVGCQFKTMLLKTAEGLG